MHSKTTVVCPWHRTDVRDEFLKAWGLDAIPDWLIMEQDVNKEGCAVVKNRGIQRAIDGGAEIVCVLDSDCFPRRATLADPWPHDLQSWASEHEAALQPQPIQMFEVVTDPPSRGTPYLNRTIKMPVAASMGFWQNVGDYDAPAQLVHGAHHPMEFKRGPIFGRYFAFSGMNCAFPAKWWPTCQFINVSRYDDIWCGFLFQKIAYSQGHCFNLNGPDIFHSRQSNVWANLRDEAKWMEESESLWQKIHEHPSNDYATLRKLLPV